MVKRIKRQLSLFLVAAIAMSYLVSPQGAKAQEVISDGISEGGGGKISATNDECQQKATPFDLNAPGTILTSLPPYRHVCFAIQGDEIVHKFTYTLNPNDINLYQVTYAKVKNFNVYGGCDKLLDALCNKETPGKFNYFTFHDKVTFNDESEDSKLSLRFTSIPVDLYTFKSPIKYTTSGGLDSEPNAFLIAYQNKLVYGFYSVNNQREKLSQADRIEDRKSKNKSRFSGVEKEYDYQFLRPESPNSYRGRDPRIHRPWRHYIALVNGLAGNILPYETSPLKPIDISKLSEAEKTALTVEAVKRVFGLVSSDDIRLEDDEVNSSQASRDKTPPAPDSAPLAIVKKAATSLSTILNQDIYFKLTNDDRVRSGFFGGLKNNYFIFKLISGPEKLNDPLPVELTTALIDPSRVYLGIDIAGNIAFLVDNKDIGGGLFTSGKDILNAFWAVGRFDHNNTTASRNTNNEPLFINLDQYRDKITSRVYNEPDTTNSGTRGLAISPCGAIISYPNLNSGYKSSHKNVFGQSIFPDDIPAGDYRKCINVSPGGWLYTWGIKDVALDQSPDDCVNAFDKVGPLGIGKTLIGSPLCAMMRAAIGAATALAFFSIDLLIEAVGLQ